MQIYGDQLVPADVGYEGGTAGDGDALGVGESLDLSVTTVGVQHDQGPAVTLSDHHFFVVPGHGTRSPEAGGNVAALPVRLQTGHPPAGSFDDQCAIAIRDQGSSAFETVDEDAALMGSVGVAQQLAGDAQDGQVISELAGAHRHGEQVEIDDHESNDAAISPDAGHTQRVRHDERPVSAGRDPVWADQPWLRQNPVDAPGLLGNAPVGIVRDEDSIADADGDVVDADGHFGQGLPLAVAPVDRSDLSRACLGGHDPAARVELDRSRHVDVGDDQLGLPRVEVESPDLVGEDLREVQPAVRAHGESIGAVEILEQNPGRHDTGRIDLDQTAAGSELVDVQAPSFRVHRDAVGAGQIVADNPIGAVWRQGSHPAHHGLRGVQGAVGSENGVVWAVDAVAEPGKQLVLPGVDIDRGYLGPEYLRHVEPMVRSDGDAVGPGQPARWRHGLHLPAWLDHHRCGAVHLPAVTHSNSLQKGARSDPRVRSDSSLGGQRGDRHGHDH